jgi:hypothetical protein
MAKLNNLLSFKEYSEVPGLKQKKTKRTDVGLDVLNEHFYDKLANKIMGDLPIDEMKIDFKNRIIKSIESGQIKDLVELDDGYKFKILNREFKIICEDECIVYIKTPNTMVNPTMSEWIEFEISEDDADEIVDKLDDIDYLD